MSHCIASMVHKAQAKRSQNCINGTPSSGKRDLRLHQQYNKRRQEENERRHQQMYCISDRPNSGRFKGAHQQMHGWYKLRPGKGGPGGPTSKGMKGTSSGRRGFKGTHQQMHGWWCPPERRQPGLWKLSQRWCPWAGFAGCASAAETCRFRHSL